MNKTDFDQANVFGLGKPNAPTTYEPLLYIS